MTPWQLYKECEDDALTNNLDECQHALTSGEDRGMLILQGIRTKIPQTKPPRHKPPDKNPLDKNPPCQKPPGQKPPRENL